MLVISTFACSDPDEYPDTTPETPPTSTPEEPPEITSDTPPIEEPPESSEEQMTEVADSDAIPWGIFPFSFAVQDIYGNTKTELSMGEKQLFFVHLWATWCPPCVAEMPELAMVAKEYGDRVGFLGLLGDFSENPDGAIAIIESSDKPDFFLTVDAMDAQLSGLLDLVQTGYVPTTVIFTSDGNMFEPLVGAYGMGYAEILDAMLEG